MAETFTTDQTRVTAETGTSTVPAATRTRTIRDLVDDIGYLRNVTRIIGEDVGEIHREALEVQLVARARDLARRPAVEMLNELADQGFAWRDIARMVGVSVPAVRRWRQGDPPTPGHLLDIARLLAFVDIARSDHVVYDVAAWMEVPISPEVPLSGIDLAADGRYGELLELAANQVTPEFVLDRWRPDWRERYRSEFEVFEAPDGELGIRPNPEGTPEP